MEENKNSRKQCDACGGDVDYKWNFCPNCGLLLNLHLSTKNEVVDVDEEIHIITVDELPGPFVGSGGYYEH